LIRQFGIPRLVVGEAETFTGQHEWLAAAGVEVTLLDDAECRSLMARFIEAHSDVWLEDIGED
jgi:cytosine deaminase